MVGLCHRFYVNLMLSKFLQSLRKYGWKLWQFLTAKLVNVPCIDFAYENRMLLCLLHDAEKDVSQLHGQAPP